MALTAGQYGRAKSVFFAVVVLLWALTGSLGVSACLLDGCADGCSRGACAASPAEATSPALASPGCTCGVLQSPPAEAVTASADGAVSQAGTAWSAAALVAVDPVTPPRPRFPHPESRPRKPLSVITAVTGSRAPPSA